MPVIPALWEAKVGVSPEVMISRPARPTWWNPISIKNTKISRAWWWVPVITETEAGELLEHRRQRLQWTKIVPLHSNLGDRVRLCLKKKEPDINGNMLMTNNRIGNFIKEIQRKKRKEECYFWSQSCLYFNTCSDVSKSFFSVVLFVSL